MEGESQAKRTQTFHLPPHCSGCQPTWPRHLRGCPWPWPSCSLDPTVVLTLHTALWPTLPAPSCPAHGWAGPSVEPFIANWNQLVPNRRCVKIKTSQGVISYFKFLKCAGESESSTRFGFENSIHITENVAESLKVLPSGGYKATIPRSPEKLSPGGGV